MKMIPKLRKHNYLARIGIFLIAIALIVGTVSCEGDGNGNGAVKYTLTMTANPPAGGTATDLTGGSPYTANTVVNIQAAANPSYQFVSWSAPAGQFGNATAATTTFTMPAQNVIVTANFVMVYNLTMAVTPAGGGTATDLTGASPYAAGTVVNIQAVANTSYQFFNWTAPAGTLANATAAQTNFTMPAQDVTVTAHFVLPPLDHFKCYGVEGATYVGENVTLVDQFIAINATVGEALFFANPVSKVHMNVTTPISNWTHHLTVYNLTYEEEPQWWQVEVDNQFRHEQYAVYGPVALAVPTQKEYLAKPVGLDHYLVYLAYGGTVNQFVDLFDQFWEEYGVLVGGVIYFANPVQKTHGGNVTEIKNSEDHLVFYDIYGASAMEISVSNQLGEQSLNLSFAQLLAVPSEKIDWYPWSPP